MAWKHLARDDVKTLASAIVDPQRVYLLNKLQSSCQKLRFHGPRQEWEIESAAQDLTDLFLETYIGLVSRAIEKVVLTTSAMISPKNVQDVFTEICPPFSELRDALYQRFRGASINISSYDYALFPAYERLMKVEMANLALIATPDPEPFRAAVITETFLAPDTNALIHYKLLSEIMPADLELSAPINWLILEQVVSELDDKSHHGKSYYAKRGRKVKRQIRVATNDPTVFGHESKTIVFFPKELPDIWGVDLAIADNRILAQAIAFQQERRGASVTIVTGDVALMIRAEKLGLGVIELSDKLRRSRDEENAWSDDHSHS